MGISIRQYEMSIYRITGKFMSKTVRSGQVRIQFIVEIISHILSL